jgi:hypothetical protein
MNIIYFTISSVVSYVNLRYLNKQVYINKKNARESKRVLEVFPHGVIIQSGESENTFRIDFTNKEFNDSIRSIRNKIEELRKVNVVDDSEESKFNLHEFLVSKQSH